MVSLLLVELRPQTGEVLGIFGDFVRLSRGALSDSFVMVESVRRGVSGDGRALGKGMAEATFFHVALYAARCTHSEALWSLVTVSSEI